MTKQKNIRIKVLELITVFKIKKLLYNTPINHKFYMYERRSLRISEAVMTFGNWPFKEWNLEIFNLEVFRTSGAFSGVFNV